MELDKKTEKWLLDFGAGVASIAKQAHNAVFTVVDGVICLGKYDRDHFGEPVCQYLERHGWHNYKGAWGFLPERSLSPVAEGQHLLAGIAASWHADELDDGGVRFTARSFTPATESVWRVLARLREIGWQRVGQNVWEWRETRRRAPYGVEYGQVYHSKDRRENRYVFITRVEGLYAQTHRCDETGELVEIAGARTTPRLALKTLAEKWEIVGTCPEESAKGNKCVLEKGHGGDHETKRGMRFGSE